MKNSHQQPISSLKSVRLSHNGFIFSAGAVSFFTSIHDVILEKWDEIEMWTALDKDTFCNGLKFCLKDGYWKYEENAILK